MVESHKNKTLATLYPRPPLLGISKNHTLGLNASNVLILMDMLKLYDLKSQ